MRWHTGGRRPDTNLLSLGVVLAGERHILLMQRLHQPCVVLQCTFQRVLVLRQLVDVPVVMHHAGGRSHTPPGQVHFTAEEITLPLRECPDGVFAQPNALPANRPQTARSSHGCAKSRTYETLPL